MVTSVSSSTSSTTTSPSTSSSTASSSSTSASTGSTSTTNSAANIVSKMGAGSGIDITSLAQNLVDAEKAPRADAINKNISKNQAVVSGYAAVKYALSNVQAAFDGLKNRSGFNSISVSNSQPSTLSVAATSSANAGGHTIMVAALAKEQRSLGGQTFATAATAITGLTSLSFSLNGGASTAIAVGSATPSGVVDALNGAGLGLNAQLVDTGNGFKLIVSGPTGAANSFTLASNVPNSLSFNQNLQSASSAVLQVDGLDITSSTNSITSAIPGVTLNLTATNASYTVDAQTGQRALDANGNLILSGTPTSINLTNDTSATKTKLLALVTAYNDANSLLNEVTNSKSTLATYGGTLAGNSSVRALRDQLRAMVTGDSSTAGGANGTGPARTLSALRDVGIEIDKTGNLTTNTVNMDLALQYKFKDTVTLLSGNQENQGSFDTAPSGLAGDASKKIVAMLSSTGTVTTETANANTRITKFQDDLTKLNVRMAGLLVRYQKQFAAMDSIVGQTKSTQTGLTSTFAGMQAMYTNK